MEYYQSINAYVFGESVLTKTIKADEAASLPKAVVNKLRQSTSLTGPAKTLTPEDIVAVINIKTCRLVKLTGKVWDQLSSGDDIWMLTAKEWKEHSEKVLIHECKARHGKTLMIRNPAALNPRQVYEMVEAYYPHIEKNFTEVVSPALSSPTKLKPATSALPAKKPFLKAYTGSPYRPPAPYSDKRRQQLQQQQAEAGESAGNTPTAQAAREFARHSASGGHKRTPSPGKSPDRNLATSNREQTVFPPLSPTLLRRVGLGRNQQHSHAQMEGQRFQFQQDFPDADTSVLTNDDNYFEDNGESPGPLQAAFDGEASPEQKGSDRGDLEEHYPAAAVVEAGQGEDGDVYGAERDDENASEASTPPPAPTDPAPQPYLFDEPQEPHLQPTEQTPQEGADIHRAEHHLTFQAPGDSDQDSTASSDDYQYLHDAGSDMHDEVLLGTGDDGTLTTVTNSVMDTFSLQDPSSVSPRSSIHPGNDSRRGSAGQAVLEEDLHRLGVEPDAHVDDAVEAEAVGTAQALATHVGGEDSSVSEASKDSDSTVSSALPPLAPANSHAEGEHGADGAFPHVLPSDLRPSFTLSHQGSEALLENSDSDASTVSSIPHPVVPANSTAEGELAPDVNAEAGTDAEVSHISPVAEDLESDSSTVSSIPHPVVPANSTADGEPVAGPAVASGAYDAHPDGRESPAMSLSSAQSTLTHDVTLPQSVFGMSVSKEGFALPSPFSASADADMLATEQRSSAPESGQDAPAVQHLQPSVAVPTSVLPDLLGSLGPADHTGVQGLSDVYDSAGVEGRPPLRWQMTEEEGALLEAPCPPAAMTAAEPRIEHAGDVAQLGDARVVQTPAVVLTAGGLPHNTDSQARFSDLPHLSGSFHLSPGAPHDPAFDSLLDAVLGPALGPTDTALGQGVVDEDVPPLRWQVTEDEGFQQEAAVLSPAPPVLAFAGDTTLGSALGPALELDQHPRVADMDAPPLRWQVTEDEGFQSDHVMLSPPAHITTTLGPSLESTLGPALGPAEALLGTSDVDDGIAPLRWQMTTEEFLLDAPNTPPPPSHSRDADRVAFATRAPQFAPTDVDLTSDTITVEPTTSAAAFAEDVTAEAVLNEDATAVAPELDEHSERSDAFHSLPNTGAATPPPEGNEAVLHSEAASSEVLHESAADDREKVPLQESGEHVVPQPAAALRAAAGVNPMFTPNKAPVRRLAIPLLRTYCVNCCVRWRVAMMCALTHRIPYAPQAHTATPGGDHEASRTQHYARLGGACVTGSAMRGRGLTDRDWSVRRSPSGTIRSNFFSGSQLQEVAAPAAVNVGTEAIDARTGADAELGADVRAEAGDAVEGDAKAPEVGTEGATLSGDVHVSAVEPTTAPPAAAAAAAAVMDDDTAEGAPAQAVEQQEALDMDIQYGTSGGDLMFSEDYVAPTERRRELFPLYTSASIEESMESHVVFHSPTKLVGDAVQAVGDDAVALSSSGSVVGAGLDMKESRDEDGHGAGSHTADNEVAARIDLRTDAFLEAHERCASPILATTSQLITLSPDRELDSTSRFIRRPQAVDSSVEASDAETEAQTDGALTEGTTPTSTLSGGIASAIDPAAMAQEDDEGVEEGAQGADAEAETPVAVPGPVAMALSPPVSPVPAPVEPTAELIATVVAHSPVPAPVSPVPTVEADSTRELEDRVRRQAEELAEAARVKAALEARLDETRQLLQIFAAGRTPAPVIDPYMGSNSPSQPATAGFGAAAGTGLATSYSSTDLDIDALEDTLKYISVEPDTTLDGAADALPPHSHSPDGSHSSSGNTARMRKSLRRLLERKREEKRLSGAESSVPVDTAAATGTAVASSAPSTRTERPFPAAGSGRSPIKSVRTKPRPPTTDTGYGSGQNVGESSDSAFSGTESRGGRGRAAYDAAGLPIVGFTIRKEPLKGRTRPPAVAAEAPVASTAPTGIAESADDLDLSVMAVGSLGTASLQVDSAHSSARATPTVTVVSLELGDELWQSNSSDPYTPSHTHHVVDASQATPLTERPLPEPPTPPAPVTHVPIVAPIPLVPTSTQVSPRNSTSTMTVSLPDLPPNLHIKSPRHLAVTLSSSSSSGSEDEAAGEGRVSLSSVPASPPSATFSPLGSTGGKTGFNFSPRQLGVKSPDQHAHKSPVLEVLRVHSAGSGISGGEHLTPLLSREHSEYSDGESSVESNNPLLLESTPKIRGFARRAPHNNVPAQAPLATQAVLQAALEDAAQSDGIADVGGSVDLADSLHGQFFQDSFMIPSTSTTHYEPLKPESETTFHYDYNSYHQHRPELFVDTAPNSPFNPSSLFMHGGHHAGMRDDSGDEGEHRAAGDTLSGVQPARQRVLSETEMNTAANAALARRLDAAARPPALTSNASFRVSFSPSSEDDIGVTAVAPTSEPSAKVAPATEPVVVSAGADSVSKQQPPVAKVTAGREMSPSVPDFGPLAAATVDNVNSTQVPATVTPVVPVPPPAVSIVSNQPAAHSPLHVDVELPVASVPPTPTTEAARINRGDKLAPLLAFSQPFLATERYLEGGAMVRGHAGRQEVQRGIGLRDTISWCVFQLYGTPDGAMVKGIK
jgi:hypothetical protein